ncbi:MAG: DUF2764 family protein [Parachlamydiaceae bacterium]
MNHYYFLATALPRLTIGNPPEISFAEMAFLYEQNLSREDIKKIQSLRLLYDIENIRTYWLKEPLDRHGNFDENQLEEALVSFSGFPDYVYDFLHQYSELEERLRFFSKLIAIYYREQLTQVTGFFKKYFSFERNLRLILVALRAKKLNRDILAELQFESPEDPLVSQILSQKDAKNYDPPEEYQGVKLIYNEQSNEPAALNKALAEYRFQKINELVGLQVFSLDVLVAYFIKFIIVEKWQEQDAEKGNQLIKKIIQEP